MEPLEYCSVIKFLNMQGKLFGVYQEECLSYETVKNWVREFKSGFLSIHDSPREGRPNFVVTEDSVCQVKTLVMEDRRVTVKQLAAITKMSVGSIETILHDHLHMSKVSARWVPRLLTPNQKEQRADSCKELIELESKDTWFFYRIVTMDETWVHHFDPEVKSSSMQWKTPSSPIPKKARLEPFLSGLSPIRSHITLKDFWRSKKGGRNVSICMVTMWRSNKMWCKFQLSSLIPS